MNRTYREQEAILKKIYWLFWRPDVLATLFTGQRRDEAVSEVIGWAVELRDLLRNFNHFMHVCTERLPGAYLEAKDLESSLSLWNETVKSTLSFGDFVRILNEYYDFPQSNMRWRDLCCRPPAEWNRTERIAPCDFTAMFPTVPSTGLSDDEIFFLRKTALVRLQHLDMPNRKLRNALHVTCAGEVENDSGTRVHLPEEMSVPASAENKVLYKEELERRFHEGTRRLKSYRNAVPILYVLYEVVVNKLSIDGAIWKLPNLGFGYDCSSVNPVEIARIHSTLNGNGTSQRLEKKRQDKKVGDSLVLVGAWIFGRSYEEAIKGVQIGGINTSGKSTFHRLEATLKHRPPEWEKSHVK